LIKFNLENQFFDIISVIAILIAEIEASLDTAFRFSCFNKLEFECLN